MILLAVPLAACRSAAPRHPPDARYVVTDSPINVGVAPGLCVAADSIDRHAIWWWEPGASGCASRSTGPGLFQADAATISEASGSTALSFRLGTHSSTRPFIDVRLVVEGTTLRALETGATVSVHRVATLDVPEMLPRGRQ